MARGEGLGRRSEAVFSVHFGAGVESTANANEAFTVFLDNWGLESYESWAVYSWPLRWVGCGGGVV